MTCAGGTCRQARSPRQCRHFHQQHKQEHLSELCRDDVENGCGSAVSTHQFPSPGPPEGEEETKVGPSHSHTPNQASQGADR